MEKNLSSADALKKYKELVDEIKTCMFISSVEANQTARPMATTQVDDDGTTWFFTGKSSLKVHEIKQDHTVHLLYAHPGKSSYLDVWGKANLVYDRNKIEELWNPIVKAWFPDGVDDPNLCLLKINPQDAHYWDSESGKMIQFVKIIASAVTGKKSNAGVEGALKL
jgi:general stress protein 26